MSDKQKVIEQIHNAFEHNVHPGAGFLQGSYEGCEPGEVVEPFKGRTDWRTVPAEMLDANYTALSFFSEAGLRFFLPAYLVADLNDQLLTADPLFQLTGGFHVTTVEVPMGERQFQRSVGGSELLNPRRYGAMTHTDYARYRLSIFTREEAQAIVAYLEFKRDNDEYQIQTKSINASLEQFWNERAANAPPRESLIQHLVAEEQYIASLGGDMCDGP